MTTGDTRLSDTEIHALAQKVEDWSRDLTARERLFMAQIVVCAASSEPADVIGYDATIQPAFPLDAQALPAEDLRVHLSAFNKRPLDQ
jgi:hypothetical protein